MLSYICTPTHIHTYIYIYTSTHISSDIRTHLQGSQDVLYLRLRSYYILLVFPCGAQRKHLEASIAIVACLLMDVLQLIFYGQGHECILLGDSPNKSPQTCTITTTIFLVLSVRCFLPFHDVLATALVVRFTVPFVASPWNVL